MALDLHAAAKQVQLMAGDLRSSRHDRGERLEAALRTFARPLDRRLPGPLPAEVLQKRIRSRSVTWLVGEPAQAALQANDLAQPYPAPSIPADYTILAVDGSQIDVDRHGPASCFLINIGGVSIRYGAAPKARLFTRPYLYSNPDDLAIREPEGVRELAIEGPVLGIKRAVMECAALAEHALVLDAALPAVALLDGSLVLWELSAKRYPDFVREELLGRGLLPALDALQEMARSRTLAFGSYISLPRSTEVVNILRVAYCPFEGLELYGCDAFCGRKSDGGPLGKKQCNDVALGLMDRDLFAETLDFGQRSEVFSSQSPIVVEEYGPHQVCFFYLNVGAEIARIELPRWVAEDAAALELLHGGILDQCRKGQGYPLALQEAHERAVVTMQDRRAFWGLVQTGLDQQGLAAAGSLKGRSKRTRSL